MNRTVHSRVLSFLLVLAMVITMLPVSALAADGSATYKQITTVEELTSGQYVMVADKGYAPTVYEGGWLLAEAVTATDGAVTDPATNLVWTLTVDGTTVKLTDSNGVTVAPKGGNNNGIIEGDYSWSVTCADGTFQFWGQGSDTVVLASNVGSANKFRGYKTTTVSGNPAGYPSYFSLYKLDEGAVDPTPTESSEPSEEPSEPEVTISPIADALAGEEGASFTVKGVVTLLDGKNVYLQDATGGICVRMSANFSDIALGDTLIGTGNKTVYNGLPQLGSGTYEKSEGLTLSPKEVTIDALTTADICTYIQLKGVEVTEVFDSNGTYTTPNITVTDGTNSIQLYKAVVGKTDGTNWDVQVGDTIDLLAAVSCYNTTLQLRNTLATEVTVVSSGEDPTDPTDPVEPGMPFANGDNVVIYAPAYNKALSATKTGNYNVGVDVTITDGTMTGYGETEIWTVTVNEDGTVSFANGGQNLGMAESYSSMNLGAVYDDWTLIDLGGGLYNVQNVGRGNYIEWYATYSNWSTYNSSSAATDGQFQLAFYVVTGDEPVDPPVEPEVEYAEKMTELPKNGDTIIIYNSGNAMGSAASGKKLAGVAAEVTDGKLPIDEAMAQLLVTIDESGNYIFTLDGKYLTSAETGNGLSFAEELTDCGKWTMETATDGTWYIKNVGANYNGNYNQALEYYSGFTTYGIKETEFYQMQLFLVEEAPSYPIPDGTYVIWAPAYNMSLSSVYSGYYNSGVAVTESDGKLSGYTEAEIWTVTNNGDDTITISYGGQNLALAASYSSMTLGEVNDKWLVEDAGDGLFYIKNQVRGNYIEWYADKNNWSSYYKISADSEGLFALKFTPAKAEDLPSSNLPAAGDQVVIYNLNAEGVLAAENDTESIENAPTQLVDGKAVPANGGVVFTVELNGNYYRFRNETYGYLCSYGTGNNAVYRTEASEDADWTLEALGGGYKMLSRTAKYNGTSAQYLEYYADSYKTYSFYATNKDGSPADTSIYEFYFYGVADGVNLTGGIVNNPDVVFISNPVAYLGQDFTASFQVDAVFGVETLTVTASAGDVSYTLEPTEELGVYTVTVTAEQIAALNEASLASGLPSAIFALSISGTDTKGVEFANGGAIDIVDEPAIGEVTPAANTETMDDKKPVISAEITNAGEAPTVTMTVNGEEVEAVYADGVVTYTPAEDMADGRTTVTVTVKRADGKTAEKTWSFTVGKAQYQHYFGQLHSHTTYSDGSGSLDSALSYIGSLPESANVDFVAFTDHSNYFDASGAANPEDALYDMSLATANSQKLWSEYVGAMKSFNASQSDVIAIPGFEMTWSGGPGHINTFNTPGIVSRNNTTLNNKTADAGMKAYYALLSRAEGNGSISQFNHPGSTFGTFSDFAYWDALIDTRIQLVEVGNGEGQIGAGGYYPSYEYYTMALDKGWHVAPTNNQDNHKGKWGNANDARDVIITDNFTEEGIYEAIRAMRMYATEDKNLEIGYTVNGLMLGTTISEVPESLTLDVTAYDPDGSDSISKVEVIVNSGKTVHTWSDPADLADGALTVTLSPDYSYYYIRVTEGDGDLAVTAPVWVGEMLKLGISSVETATSTPVTDEALTITTTLFNSEATDATVKSLVYTVGDEVIGTDSTGYTIGASSTASVDFKYTPTAAKITTVTVTAVVEQGGTEYTFTMDITLDVQDASKLVYIGIDASHYNEYVNGNYKDSMGNFSQLAAEYNVRTVTLYESADLIAACSNDKYVAMILTAPSRRLAAAQSDPKVYTAEEIAAIKAFNEAGGTVILAGWSDNYENYDVIQSNADILHMAAAQNAVLEGLGSSLRIGDDATYDDVRSAADGVDKWRLYFNSYNFDNFLVEGVEVDPEHPYDRMYTEVFSHYGGATVYTVPSALPATVSPVVFGHSSTYSVDVDKDGLGGDSIPKYTYAEGDERLMVMATEQLSGRGLIVVSGAAFMSNFEVQATIEDSGSEKNYSNYKVCENLLNYLNPVAVSTIAEVRAQTEVGYKYTIEGIVTSNASGYDKDTAFFDCIYVQDATGGICCFPVAGNYKIGDKVRITGTTEFYQGEPELQVTSIEVIGEGTVEPTEVTASQINDRSAEGKLVKISGTVESFELANGLVQTIMVKDAKGDVARIFIDGYITTAEDVANLAVGAEITAVGLASYDDTFNAPTGPFPRIRIRDRKDVVCVAPELPEQPALPQNNGGNVTEELITIICDTDEGHTAKTYGWGDPSANIVFPAGSEPVWNEELNAWTIGVRIDSIKAYYTGLRFDKEHNGIVHDIVKGEPLTSDEYNRIDTTLVWNAKTLLWDTLTGEPFEVHVTCHTAPEAPAMGYHLGKFQIKMVGTVDDAEKIWHESLHADTVTVGEVKGNRVDGFTVDVTVTLDDSYLAAWVEKHAAGLKYAYADGTEKTVTFTMMYTGDTTGELYDGPEYWAAAGETVYSVNVVPVTDEDEEVSVIRVKGATRYETGFAIANYLKEILKLEKFEAVVVACGQKFPDALAGSYLAAQKNAPILLTDASVDADVLAYIEANLVSGGKVYILGGTAAVSQEFEDGLVAKGIDYARVKGATRYETNLEILKEAGVTADQKILIATGNNYADSLSASATGLPMLLVGNELTDAQKAFLETTSKDFVILGGEGAVSEEIEAELAAMGTVERVKGKTRYETSVEIAKYFFTAPESAVLGYANDFPDGLCAGPLAIALKAPLILTADGKTDAADAYIENFASGVVTGGTARISDEAVREIFELEADAEIVVK